MANPFCPMFSSAPRPRRKPATKRGASRRKPTAAPRKRGRLWLIALVLMSGFLGLLYLIAQQPVKTAAPSTTPTAAAPASVAPAEPKEPQFDFYTLLPEREVQPPPSVSNSSEQRATVARAEPVEYLLQVGSFKRMEDAEKQRVELLLKGFDVIVKAADIGKGETWHRVQVGPFSSRSKMSEARQALLNDGIESLVLKRALNG